MNPDPTLLPPPGSTVNWSHPLAQGLILCTLHNTTGNNLLNLASHARYQSSYNSLPPWVVGRNGLVRDYSSDIFASTDYDVLDSTEIRHRSSTAISLSSVCSKTNAITTGQYFLESSSGKTEVSLRDHCPSSPYVNGLRFHIRTSDYASIDSRWYSGAIAIWPEIGVTTCTCNLLDATTSSLCYYNGRPVTPRNYNLHNATALASNITGWQSRLRSVSGGSFNTMFVQSLFAWTCVLSPSMAAWQGAEPYAMVDWPGLKRYFFGVALGQLDVTPSTDLVSSGYAGGPFSPTTKDYTLINSGDLPLDWTATKTQTWVTLSSASGTLAGHASTIVTVSINSGANSLPYGNHADTVIFTNVTNGNGNAERDVLLVIPTPGPMTVTPSTDLVSSGYHGGGFAPSSIDYTIRNTGGAPINWTVTNTQAWVTISDGSGTLDGGESIVITVSINGNANALDVGTYADTITFTNTTNGDGNTTRSVSLEVLVRPGALSVTPSSSTFLDSTGPQGGPFAPTSIDYTLHYASGDIDFDWTVTVNYTWLDVSLASGTLGIGESQAITISLNANANSLIVGSYSAVITFTNTTNGWGNTTRPVTLIVTESLARTLLLNLVQSELFVGGGT